ncbi:DNA-directed RNA polymerase subunit beta [Parasponia andersonii]|uniref:DNA-directed RNA polymerase subunit beta n=1 Tax=Parasponia andersonii TaxID=3476 RepID=A0A2P5C1X6_PARAD|nr:DNA-directed RNA polymerase subunit beta [Parasponia andersonii]
MSDSSGFHKTRPALGDLTNRPAKRGFSMILGDSGLKSRDGYCNNVDGPIGDSKFAKQPRLGVEDFLREKCSTDVGVDGNEKGLFLADDKQSSGSSSTSSDTDASQENTESFISSMLKQVKKSNVLVDGGVRQNVVEVGDASRDSSMSSISMPTCSGLWSKDCSGAVEMNYRDDEEERHASDDTKAQSNLVHGPLVTICKNNEGALGVDKLASTGCGSSERSRLSKQGSKSHELGRCSTLKGDGCGNLDFNEDFLKACSCSFCLKAAYIWSDLQYQDIKGRIAALKKSQKEANTLVHKSFTEKETDIHGQGNPIKLSRLESDLTGQWRSLFCHMEDILVHESNQLWKGKIPCLNC